MNEMPGWIGREVEEANRKLEVNKTRARKSLEHSSTTSKKGPKFWQELVCNLRNNTDNLPSIGLTGNTSLVSSPHKASKLAGCPSTNPEPSRYLLIPTFSTLLARTLFGAALLGITKVNLCSGFCQMVKLGQYNTGLTRRPKMRQKWRRAS